MSTIGVNFWYLLAVAYHGLTFFGMEALMVDNIDEYYPKVCACRAEGLATAANMAGLVSGGRATDYRCYEDSDDPMSDLIDCETEQLLLTYDLRSCFESINWFYCTDDAEGTVTGEEDINYISLRSDCVTDDRDYFIWYYDSMAGDGEGYLRDSEGEFLEKWTFLEDYSESDIDASGQEDFWDLDGFTEPSFEVVV